MSGFFELDATDLDDGKAKFSNGDTATMKVSKVAKKDVKGAQNIIITSVVTNSSNPLNLGKEHTEFYNMTNEYRKKTLGWFLVAFFSPAEVAAMGDANAVIGRSFSCSFTEYNGYVNMDAKSVRQVSEAPQFAAQQPVAQPAQPVQQVVQPVAQPVQETQPQGGLTTNIF